MTRRPRRTSHASRLRWSIVGVVFAAGTGLWLLGLTWAIVLVGLALLGFVLAAWLDVRPQAGHVHDSGLSAYGVSGPPPITPDRP